MSEEEIQDQVQQNNNDELQQPQLQKKSSSYTYWVNNDPNYFKEYKELGISNKPTQVSNPNEIKVDVIKGASSWNTGNTWEEKKVPINMIESYLKEKLVGLQTKDQKCSVSVVDQVSGEMTAVMSRGKKKAGYDLKITICLEDKDGKTAKLKFSEFQDDGDYDFKVSSSDSKDIKESVEKSSGFFQEKISQLIKEFVEQF